MTRTATRRAGPRTLRMPPAAVGPIDVGNGLIAASIGGAGAWLSLGAPHARHGFIELTGLPPFDPAWRGDPAAVRRYRAWMAEDVFWFLAVEVGDIGGSTQTRTLVLGDRARIRELRGAHYRHEITTRALPGEPAVEQRHRIAGAPRRAIVRFRGRLDAHPLPEITEVDPPTATRVPTRLLADGDRLLVAAEALDACAEVTVAVDGGRSCGWTVDGAAAQLVVTRQPGETLELMLKCSLPAAAQARRRAVARRGRGRWRPAAAGGADVLPVPAALDQPLARMADRIRSYVLDCTAMRVGEDEVCLLTDHRILPLSWTRDAYWQAALLLAGAQPAVDVVAAHLRWLWRRCERPRGLWMRSHRPNGAVKDPALQADQQLYPLLELLDYLRVAGELPGRASWWGPRVAELWAVLPVGDEGLIRSDENPADDRAELPFPLSSQLLYWVAAARLAECAGELGLDVDFASVARRVAEAIERHFIVDGPLGRQWAYEVDARGSHRLYHDANDLPTALAPLLGFCPPTDPVWATTMRFALGPHNPAYCPGEWGGLGSLHTPGTWTLGDVQEWVAAGLLGEPRRSERALERLLAVASPDGLLPEAYDPSTGGEPIRRWFAWPGAALGALLTLRA